MLGQGGIRSENLENLLLENMAHRTRYIFEACANSINSAINAEAGGADRVELCQNLDVGGLTPSYGFIRMAKEMLSIPIHVLIRPRPGNFIYNDAEFNIMLSDIQACHSLSCEGVVIGMLDGDHQVDVSRMTQLMETASPMQVTFHRAFDDAVNKSQALEDIVGLGCSRILTIGGTHDRAHLNAKKLAELVASASGRIVIMPGGGISSETLHDLVTTSGASEYHGSAAQKCTEETTKHQSLFNYETNETSTDLVRRIVALLKSMDCEDSNECGSNLPTHLQ